MNSNRITPARQGRLGWALGLLLLALPATLHAQFTYTTSGGTITITGYTGPGGAVTIPDTIDGLPVTIIGEGAFAGFADLTSIGSGAFSDCTSLTSVTIPNSVTSIGIYTFSNCTGLTSVTIGNSVASIGFSAFSGCSSLTCVYARGEAPSFGFDVFNAAPTVTVHYLPGATGWGSSIADRPTALWIPITPTLPTLSADNPLRLVTHSPAPTSVRVQRSVNLVEWEDWQTVSRDEGPSELQDSGAGTTPYRFYRGIEQ